MGGGLKVRDKAFVLVLLIDSRAALEWRTVAGIMEEFHELSGSRTDRGC